MVKVIGFRCPDDLVAEIEHRQEITGQDKTSVTISMLRGMPSVDVESRRTFPPIKGTYLVWAPYKLLYIGHTDNLRETFLNHPRLIEFLNENAKIAWFDEGGCHKLQIEPCITQ